MSHQRTYLLFLFHFYERLLQICGLWPVTFDRNTLTLHSSKVLVVYSICALVVIQIAFISAASSLTFVWPNDETLLSSDLCSLYVIVIIGMSVLIFLTQYSQLKNLTNLRDHSVRVLRKIQQIHLKTAEPYASLLLLFTVKSVGLLVAESYCLVRQLLVLSPQSPDCPMSIIIWVIYNSTIALLPDVVFGLVLVISYHFRIVNAVISEILVDARSGIVCSNPHPVKSSHKHHLAGIRMQICCDLSDRLDEIAVLHQELSYLTFLANDALSLQLLIWTIWSVTLFVIKLFLEYFLVAAALADATISLNKDLFVGILLSMSTTFAGVAFLASACSMAMCEVKNMRR